ncbi:recombinase RecT [Gordonia soli]|uniref:Phage recombination protein Bet n=1 Tax=Gordonia soli NBRC 108243 TaxID=1223545 RepID=M0QQ38_9ACTN|nr:recombinase RecT [Gordonia soli]GAC70805.1 hypothetical protein GS4_41_00520 [Gordonia soli NBRC 108243]
MSSTEIATTTGAVATQPTSDLAIQPNQTEFTSVQRAALAQLGIEEATDEDVQVFFHQAKRTGLDPFARQIYMIGRRTKVKEWDPNQRKQIEKWVMKQTIQIGIDGYRLGGRRIASALGIKLEKDGPHWHDGNGWVDVWLDPARPPAAARYSITRDGETFTATAMYSEYVQTYNTQQGPQPNSMWSKMPANQLAKCAEAAAWRQAFPDQFSGVIFEDAAQHTVIDADVIEEEPKTKQGSRGTAGLAAALGVDESTADEPEPQDGPVGTIESGLISAEPSETPEDEADSSHEPRPEPKKPTQKQIHALNALLSQAGLTKAEKKGRQIVVSSFLPNREDPAAALTADETEHVTTQLSALVENQGEQALIDTVEALIQQHDQQGAE